MDVLKTLQFMKPDIKVMVWENDISRIEYNETEEFRPTEAEILAVDQTAVSEYWAKKDEEIKSLSLDDLHNQMNILINQYNNLKENKDDGT